MNCEFIFCLTDTIAVLEGAVDDCHEGLLALAQIDGHDLWRLRHDLWQLRRGQVRLFAKYLGFLFPAVLL